MSLYQLADGRWGVDYRDEHGRRWRKLVGVRDAAAAVETKLRETGFLARAALRNFAQGEVKKLSHARDEFLAHYPALDRTKANLRDRLDRLVRFAGDCAIAQVTPRTLDAFAAQRTLEVAPSTRAYETQVIKRFFDWLVHETYLPASPATGLRVPKAVRQPVHILTFSEEALTLAALTQQTWLRTVLALDAGLTISEIHALRRQNVNLTESTLTTWRSKTRRERTIPLTHRLDHALEVRARHLAPDSLLFAWGGRALKNGTDYLKPHRERLGFRFTFHELRHTFATRLAATGCSKFIVAALLGHALEELVWGPDGLPRTTTRYVHVALEELRAAILDMERSNPNCQTSEPNSSTCTSP